MSRFYVSKFYKYLNMKYRRGIEYCFHFKKLVNFIIHYKSAEVLLYPCVKGYNGGIIARWLSLITAYHFLIREGLEYFSVLCYNGCSKKTTSGWSLRLMRGGDRSIGFRSDHNLDHPRLRTTWKQCLKEHTKAVISD